MIDVPHGLLILSAVLFCIGLTGVCIRRNPLVMFMCIELMLNAANLTFATFSRYSGLGLANTDLSSPEMATGLSVLGGAADGPMFIFIVMTIAAAEAVVGLAIIIAIFRSRSDVDADDLASLKG